jgi:hypothetical protein
LFSPEFNLGRKLEEKFCLAVYIVGGGGSRTWRDKEGRRWGNGNQEHGCRRWGNGEYQNMVGQSGTTVSDGKLRPWLDKRGRGGGNQEYGC